MRPSWLSRFKTRAPQVRLLLLSTFYSYLTLFSPPLLRFSFVKKHVQFVKPTDFLEGSDRPRYRRKPVVIGPDAYQSRARDAFHQLNIDPLYEAMNPTLLSAFVTEMGKIRKRAQTNLTWRNQRKITKAIKRAKLMGIMPWHYRLPS